MICWTLCKASVVVMFVAWFVAMLTHPGVVHDYAPAAVLFPSLRRLALAALRASDLLGAGESGFPPFSGGWPKPNRFRPLFYLFVLFPTV
jgi:hypothetical protein